MKYRPHKLQKDNVEAARQKDLAVVGGLPHLDYYPQLVKADGHLGIAPQEVLLRVSRAGILFKELLSQFPMGTPLTPSNIQDLSAYVWKSMGVRFLLIDFFYDGYACKTLSDFLPEQIISNRIMLDFASRLAASIVQPKLFYKEYATYGDSVLGLLKFVVRENCIEKQVTSPAIDNNLGTSNKSSMTKHSPVSNGGKDSQWVGPTQVYHVRLEEKIVSPPYPNVSLTFSQKSALKKLRASIRIARENPTYGGVHVRPNIFVVGMSGVGKTTVIKEAALKEAMPFFSVTLPSWVVLGARHEPTLGTLADWLSDNPSGGVIHIDEIEKIPVDHESGNHSWFSSVRTEICRLLDRDVQGLCGFGDSSTYQALRKSVFIASGTFQDIYKAQISREAFFDSPSDENSSLESEYSQLIPVSLEDIIIGKHLPEEMLYRFSPELVEVRQPSVSELFNYLSTIDCDASIYRSDHDIMSHARSIFQSGRGLRGLEEYVYTLLQKRDEVIQDSLYCDFKLGASS